LKKYNNLIFLQTDKKITKKKKHHKHRSRKSVPGTVLAKSKLLKWTPGVSIFFGMMNENTNGFAGLVSFMRFYRFSSLYLEIDNMAKSRVSYDVLSRIKKPMSLTSLAPPDQYLYN